MCKSGDFALFLSLKSYDTHLSTPELRLCKHRVFQTDLCAGEMAQKAGRVG